MPTPLIDIIESETSDLIKIDRLGQCLRSGATPDETDTTTGAGVLHRASAKGGPLLVDYLLTQKHNLLEALDNHGKNAMVYAIHAGNLPVCKFLAEKNKNNLARPLWTWPDKYGLSPIHHAAHGGQKAIVSYLVEELKVDVNVPASDKLGSTALYLAAQYGQTTVINYLVKELNVDTNARTFEKGNTPLHVAALEGHSEAVKGLLQLDAESGQMNNKGDTPFESAIEARQLDTATLLYKPVGFAIHYSTLFAYLSSVAQRGQFVRCMLAYVASNKQATMLEQMTTAHRRSATNYFGISASDLLALTQAYHHFMRASQRDYPEVLDVETTAKRLRPLALTRKGLLFLHLSTHLNNFIF